jgi:hypothetical protein
MNPLAVPIILINRVKHLVYEARRIPKLEGTIREIRKQHANAVEKGMPHYARIYNVGLYILVLEYDVAILKNDALFSIRLWKKRFVARQLATLLYEASQDLPKLLGKEFRQSLRAIDISPDEMNVFNSIAKKLNKYKNDNRNILKKLRNFVGAHRDHDAAKQLEVIEQVELLEIMELAAIFYEAKAELVPFMTRITLKLGDWRVLIKHIKIEPAET